MELLRQWDHTCTAIAVFGVTLIATEIRYAIYFYRLWQHSREEAKAAGH